MMAVEMEMTGTEEVSLELSGHADAEQALVLAGPGLEVPVRRGLARASLLLLEMRRLTPLQLDYREALWRLAVRYDGEAAWLAVACDLDRALVRWLAAPLIRYPVRAARIDLRVGPGGTEFHIVGPGSAGLQVHATETAAQPPPEAPLPLLVRDRGGRLHRVPWGEVPAPERRVVRCQVRSAGLAEITLGAGAGFDPAGVLHRGRRHRCGPARPADSP